MKLTSVLVILAVMCSLAGCQGPTAGADLAAGRENPPGTGEVLVVLMAGWTQGAWSMERIDLEMVRQLAASLPNHRVSVHHRLPGLLPIGDSELFLAIEYEAWKQRKDTAAGRYDKFVAVGHSSGATAIYNLLRNGDFKNGPHMPAFLGLVDMVLPVGSHDLNGRIPTGGGGRTDVVHYYSAGTQRVGGIRNVAVGGADHFSIVSSERVARGLAADAAAACQQDLLRP